MAGTTVLCSCCGNYSTVEFKDFERLNVDVPTMTVQACRSCLVTLKKEPVVAYVEGEEPQVIAKFRKIAREGAAGIRYCGRSYTIDSFSASAVIAVWDKLSENHRKDWMAKHNGDPVKMTDLAFRLINSANKA